MLFVALFLGPMPIRAQDREGGAIQEIRVDGLKRTRPAVVQELLSTYRGRHPETVDAGEVAALLIDTGIFEDIRVGFSQGPDGAIMEIGVREKWSLIPLPIFAAGSDGIVAGAALIDANAFGLNDKLFAVGLALPGGWMGSVAYVSPAAGSAGLGWSASAFYSRQERADLDAYGVELRRYGFDALALGLGINRTIAGPVSGELGLEYRSRLTEQLDGAPPAPDGYAALGLRGGLGVRAPAFWDGVFLRERSASLDYRYYLGLEGDSFAALSARFQYELAPLPGLKLVSCGSAIWSPDAPPAAETGADAARLIILPGAFVARSLAGLSLGLEFRLLSLGPANFAGLASYQIGVSEGPLIGLRLDHGPAAGLRLYLARVAVPAIDLSVAYNAVTGIPRLSFGIGMRM